VRLLPFGGLDAAIPRAGGDAQEEEYGENGALHERRYRYHG
jgi:hypothetical protein